jgi:hypothetical protein
MRRFDAIGLQSGIGWTSQRTAEKINTKEKHGELIYLYTPFSKPTPTINVLPHQIPYDCSQCPYAVQ